MYSKNLSFPEVEKKISEYWKRTEAFEKSKEISKDREEYFFYDGPPFATGLPHYGHILSGTIKDIMGRFMFQQGFRINRRFGWDCHGLPIEYEIDKKLGITKRSQVLDMGIKEYNRECRNIVMKYSAEWEETVERMGRWVDFRNGYMTMDITFMESTWHIFKQLWIRNKIYKGYKVMPFSTACKTPLSNFEANQNYKEVSDPSVLVAFPLKKKLEGRHVEFLAWTTTPWTLPANCALIVNKNIKYVLYENRDGRNFIICEKRIEEYFNDGGKIVRALAIDEILGAEYEQPYDFYEELREKGYFRVYAGEFVSDANGTGIVHCAPAFGEDDYKISVECGLVAENGNAPCPVDENGCYTVGDYKGIYVKDLDKIVLKDLGKKIVMNQRIVHSYPFCWRSDTPLVYKLTPNWFVKVKESREILLKNNEKIRWVPETIKYRRFHNWLEQARDWAIGRNRFWGTPIPVWIAADGEMLCVGSIKELEELSGEKVTDLHREHIDDIVIRKDGKEFRRCEEVLDCWFESGSMPYAQENWPFKEGCETTTDENGNLQKKGMPADFIGEGLDQTRGWFYTLHVLSSLLFGSPAFKNVICFGIVLAEDGKKMSKRLKNYPDPQSIFDKYGADALRLYLISSPVVLADNLKFSENGVKDMLKTILIPWKNLLVFYMECRDGKEVKITSEIDEWIIGSMNNLCLYLTEYCKSYTLNGIVGRIASFIDDLSNWYVRINRKSLRAEPGILRKLLLDLSVVLAPFTPFFSEYCYQSILRKSGGGESVHFSMYPKASEVMKSNFEEVKAVIDVIRQMRESMKLQLKRPLKYVEIVGPADFRAAVEKSIDLIKLECNIIDLKLEDMSKYEYSVTIKPCFASLRTEMDTMKQKLDIIKKLSKDKVVKLSGDQSITAKLALTGILISPKDVIIERKFKDVPNSRTAGNFGVIFDISIDEEIVDMKAAREFYSFLQKLRKSVGLNVEDSIGVQIENEYIEKIIKKYYPSVIFAKSDNSITTAKYSFDDDVFNVQLFQL